MKRIFESIHNAELERKSSKIHSNQNILYWGFSSNPIARQHPKLSFPYNFIAYQFPNWTSQFKTHITPNIWLNSEKYSDYMNEWLEYLLGLAIRSWFGLSKCPKLYAKNFSLLSFLLFLSPRTSFFFSLFLSRIVLLLFWRSYAHLVKEIENGLNIWAWAGPLLHIIRYLINV